MAAHPITQDENRSRNRLLCDLFGGALFAVKKCRKRYSSINTDTVTGSETRLEIEILVCFRPGLYFCVTARFLLYLLVIRQARRICMSSAHGAVEKVGSDSSEKRLPSKTDERRTASALSICRRYKLDGLHVNGAPVSLAQLSTWRRNGHLVFDGRCDRSCGYVLV